MIKSLHVSLQNLMRKYRMWRSIEWKLDWLIHKAKHGEYRTTKKQDEKHYAEDLFKRQLYYYECFSDGRHHFAIHEFEQLIDKLFEDGILEEHYFGMSYVLTMKGKSFIGYRKTKRRETVKAYFNGVKVFLGVLISLLLIFHTTLEIIKATQDDRTEVSKSLDTLSSKIDTLESRIHRQFQHRSNTK